MTIYLTNGGPDNNLNVQKEECGFIEIAPGSGAQIEFSSEAGWEQALCIYSDQRIQVTEKGTYHPERNLDPWSVPKNVTNRGQVYAITGWYKEGGPSARKPWNQSEVRTSFNSDGTITVGFDDGVKDGDYNDIVATVKFIQ